MQTIIRDVRLFGLFGIMFWYLTFPIKLIWHVFIFVPKVKKAAIDEYCAGDSNLFEISMLDRYAIEHPDPDFEF